MLFVKQTRSNRYELAVRLTEVSKLIFAHCHVHVHDHVNGSIAETLQKGTRLDQQNLRDGIACVSVEQDNQTVACLKVQPSKGYTPRVIRKSLTASQQTLETIDLTDPNVSSDLKSSKNKSEFILGIANTTLLHRWRSLISERFQGLGENAVVNLRCEVTSSNKTYDDALGDCRDKMHWRLQV